MRFAVSIVCCAFWRKSSKALLRQCEKRTVSSHSSGSLLLPIQQTIDTAKRTQLYLEAQKVFKREQPFTPIAYPNKYQIINKRVVGFKINFFHPTIFSGVGLAE